MAEWIHVDRRAGKDYILVPGWILTEPYRVNSGQLRISVQPLTENEQLEYRELVRDRFLSDQFLLEDYARDIERDCDVKFWKIEG